MAKTDGTDLMSRPDVKEKPKTLRDFIVGHLPEISQALPKQADPDQMLASMLAAARGNPNLQICTPISWLCAVVMASQMGLKPNTPLGQCYIIPYWNSKIKRYEAQFQIGYKGIIEMGYRSDTITMIYADKVKKGDTLKYMKGTEEFLAHDEHPEKWEYDKATGEPIVTHYYAVYKTIKGEKHFSIATRDSVLRHKERYSPAAKKDAFSPWNTTEDLMSQKTLLKDVMRYAPLSENDRRILATDETVKSQITPNMLDAPSIYEFNPDDLKGMDDVDFEGETKTPPAVSEGKKVTAQESDKEKGKAQGVRKEPGEDMPGQPEENPGDSGKVIEPELDRRPITPEQIKMLFAKGKALGYNTPALAEEFKDKVKAKFKLQHLPEMQRHQFDKVNIELDNSLKEEKDKAAAEATKLIGKINKELGDAEQGKML